MTIAMPASASMPLSSRARKPRPYAWPCSGIQASARCALTASSAVQPSSTSPGRPVASGDTAGTASSTPMSRPTPSMAARPIRPVRLGSPTLWPASAETCSAPQPPPKNKAAASISPRMSPMKCRIVHESFIPALVRYRRTDYVTCS